MVKNSKGLKGNRHFWFKDDSIKLPFTLPLFINHPQTRMKNKREKQKSKVHIRHT